MKIRNGFVSNSSSSSFVYLVNKNTETNCKICKNVFNIETLVKLLKNQELDGGVDFYGSVVDGIDYLKDQWDWGQDYGNGEIHSKEELDQLKSVPGYSEIIIASVGYHSEGAIEVLNMYEKAGKITHIYGEM